ncbi:MAG: GNAT family N-acetyltransferase [Candidatus Aenigmatarchaeota archaeon]
MKVLREKNKFYVKLNGEEAYLLFRVERNKMNIYKVFVPEKYRGKNIAKRLTIEALNYAKNNKMKVVPECSYIKEFINKSKQWTELI